MTLQAVFTEEMKKVNSTREESGVEAPKTINMTKSTGSSSDEKSSKGNSGDESKKGGVSKVSNKFPGLSMATIKTPKVAETPSKNKTPKVAETPSKNNPKPLPIGISVNSRKDAKPEPEKEIKAPASPLRRAKSLRNISISKNAPPATPTSKTSSSSILPKPNLSVSKKKDLATSAEPSSLATSGVSIRKNSEEKEGLDHRVKSMLDTVKKVTDSSRKSALGEVDASADQPDAGGVGSGIRKYDDLLSRIKGQLKVVGNM